MRGCCCYTDLIGDEFQADHQPLATDVAHDLELVSQGLQLLKQVGPHGTTSLLTLVFLQHLQHDTVHRTPNNNTSLSPLSPTYEKYFYMDKTYSLHYSALGWIDLYY